MENRIEGRVLFNHVVEYSRVILKFNHLVELFLQPVSICRVVKRAAFLLFGGPMKTLLAAAIILSLTAPAIAQAVISALPKDMLGIWGFKAEDCEDENGDGRLIIEKRRIASFASVFKLTAIRQLPHGVVQASATRFDEGEQRGARASLKLFFLKPDMLSVSSDREEGMAYWRCTTPGKTS